MGDTSRAELVSQLGTVCWVISSDDFSAYGYPVTAQQMSSASEAAFSESREVRSWQRYRLGASL